MTGPEGDRKSNFTGTGRPRNGDNLGPPSDNAALVGLLDPESPTMSRGHKHTSSTSTSFTPTSPIAASYPSPMGGGSGAIVGLGMLAGGADTSGPYYRPPRPRTNTIGMTDSPAARSRGSWASGDCTAPRYDAAGNPVTPTGSGGPRALIGHVHSSSQGSLPGSRGITSEEWDAPTALNTNNPNSGAGTPSALGTLAGPGSVRHQNTDSTLGGSGRGNTDYAVREMDFYYGVRGPALSSTAPSRKLGTGPADPTSPVAVAKGWLLTKFGRRKEKAKGFEVVRSSRAPQMLREIQEAAAAEQARKEQGKAAGQAEIGAAVTQDGNGSDSSDDEEGSGQRRVGKQKVKTTTDSEEEDGSGSEEGEEGDNFGEGPSNSRGAQPMLLPLNTGGDMCLNRSLSSRSQPGVDGAPRVPRKSSKRKSSALSYRAQTPVPYDPQMGEIIISPTPTRNHDLYDPPLPSQAHLRHLEEDNRNSLTNSSTRLPFQSPSLHSRNSLRDDRRSGLDGANHSPTNSRSSSNASSLLPPVPGLYGTRGGDSGSMTGSAGGQIRPASVGTVNRHRMEDSLTEVTDHRVLSVGLGSTAELVERSNSIGSIEGTVGQTQPETQGPARAKPRYSLE